MAILSRLRRAAVVVIDHGGPFDAMSPPDVRPVRILDVQVVVDGVCNRVPRKGRRRRGNKAVLGGLSPVGISRFLSRTSVTTVSCPSASVAENTYSPGLRDRTERIALPAVAAVSRFSVAVLAVVAQYDWVEPSGAVTTTDDTFSKPLRGRRCARSEPASGRLRSRRRSGRNPHTGFRRTRACRRNR